MTPDAKKAEYQLVTPNEDPRLAVFRKIQEVDYTIADLEMFIEDIDKGIAEASSYATYQGAIIENIKGFHENIVEMYEVLPPESQSALIQFCDAVKKKEAYDFKIKADQAERQVYVDEIAELKTLLPE